MADVWHTVFGVAGEWQPVVPLRLCVIGRCPERSAHTIGGAIADRRDDVPDGAGQE
jgi:hypothetical protein